MTPSAQTAIFHGHSREKAPVHKDELFCSKCGAWFLPLPPKPFVTPVEKEAQQ